MNLTFIPGIELSQVVGRDTTIKNIDKLINNTENKIVVISGPAGIGKTTTALAYAYSEMCVSTYHYIAWVSAGNRPLHQEIANAFIQSNKFVDFQLDLKPEKNFENLTRFIHHLKGRTLLIIDNADDVDELYTYRQDLLNLNVDILITSRSTPENFVVLEVGPLEPEKAVELFSKYYTKEHDAVFINKILEKIHYHSLPIILLAKVCQNNDKLNLRKLHAIVSKKSFQEPELNVAVNMPEKLGHAFDSNYQTLRGYLASLFKKTALSEQESYYLKVFLLLPPERDYSLDFLIDLLYIQNEDEAQFNTDLNKLVTDGWLSKRHSQNATSYYRIHQLVQVSLKIYLKPDLLTCRVFVWRVAMKLAFTDQRANPLQSKLLWSEIGDAIGTYFQIPKAGNSLYEMDNLSLLYNNLALCFQDLSSYQKALDYQLYAVKINESLSKEPNLSIAKNYNNLSSIYRDMDDIDKALETQLKTIGIKEKILEKNDPSLARSYNNISLLYSELNEYEKALEMQLKAIAVREKFKEEPNVELTNSYNNVSTIYSNLGDMSEAIKYQLKAVDRYQEIYRSPHPAMATALNNLALLYREIGNIDKALESHLLALDIRLVTLNKFHSDMENSYSNLAILYLEKNQFSDALSHIERAIEILQHIFPQGHSRVDRAIQIKNSILDRLKQLN